jgi:Myb-like DNA-binding domain
LEIRNKIIEKYKESNGMLFLDSLKDIKGAFKDKLAIFDFLEDNKIINNCIELKILLTELEFPSNTDNKSSNQSIFMSNAINKQSNSCSMNFSVNQPMNASPSLDYRNMNINRNIHDSSPLRSPINMRSPLNTARSPINAQESNTSNNGPNGESLFDIKSNRKLRRKYLKREILENALCNCGSPSHLFTSDLYFICNSCFEASSYPLKYSPRNFHKITNDLLQSLWTKKEEYILLKNIESFGDDWSRVSQGLNKSPDQCIFHFIKMPILEDLEVFPCYPFSQVPNQITTFISYVCANVHPSISTEVSKAFIKYVERGNLMEILLNVSVHKAMEILNVEKAKKARMEKIESEALIKRISLKVDAVKDMGSEIAVVRSELEDAREKLIEELNRNN